MRQVASPHAPSHRVVPDLNRRDTLRMAIAGAKASLVAPGPLTSSQPRPRAAKRVLVAGAGIGGLCCAYELMERGHDVMVLEASGRPGGHVKTIHDPLPDGLYVDVGAEHFTRPGYEQYWKYVEKFGLTAVPYPHRIDMLRRIDGVWYTEAQLQEPRVLRSLGFNPREIDFIARRGWTELPLLYLGPYIDAIGDEYQPFGVGLDRLDELSAGELFSRDGASDAAMRFNGLRRGDGTPAGRNGELSALFRIWQAAIVKRRGLPVFPREVFRLKGGNQLMTDTFAAKLGGRVRLGCPITSIERGISSVTVHLVEFGEPAKLEAEYLVCSIPMAILKDIPVEPAWPEAKAYAIRNLAFSSHARVVLQSRTKFWRGDVSSINLESGDPAMYVVGQTADEVPGPRGLLMGSGRADVTADEALAAFRRFYPGKKPPIEQAIVHNWAKDPWAFGCERMGFPLGELRRFWPHIMEAVGRVHFAGSFADNLSWGMDAATRSANRVAEAIDAI
jgi:monoamine oxidase